MNAETRSVQVRLEFCRLPCHLSNLTIVIGEPCRISFGGDPSIETTLALCSRLVETAKHVFLSRNPTYLETKHELKLQTFWISEFRRLPKMRKRQLAVD